MSLPLFYTLFCVSSEHFLVIFDGLVDLFGLCHFPHQLRFPLGLLLGGLFFLVLLKGLVHFVPVFFVLLDSLLDCLVLVLPELLEVLVVLVY